MFALDGRRLMKRRLVVMRHAKSSWKSSAATDHERPLNARGRRAAPLVGARLVELGWAPEVVLSSDSARTRETLERMQPILSAGAKVHYSRDLYLAGIEEIREQLRLVPPEVTVLLILGHNPGFEEFVTWLSGEEVTLKTASAALLVGRGEDWEASLLHSSAWNLVSIIRARELEPR